MQQTANHSTA